ncbi:MAG: ribose-phosphate pyrophosphokinase [Clostridiaceae bacterium]
MHTQIHGPMKIFGGNSVPNLAAGIAQRLGVPLGLSTVTRFSDGETSVSINETVRGCDVFVIQSTQTPTNDHLMELLIMLDAFKRASAGRINVVIPYYGYARQDRKVKSRDPITAKLVADLLTTAGADRVITMDLHSDQIQGYFNIPLDNLLGAPILLNYLLDKGVGDAGDVVMVSPDIGAVTRTRRFAERLNVPIAIIDKRRPKANVSEIMNIIGDVKDKRCILVDDMIDTGGTIANAAFALKDHGAKEVYACASHAVLSGDACDKLEQAPINRVILLDSIPLSPQKQRSNIRVLSCVDLFSEAIRRIHENEPLSSLFVKVDHK